MNEFKKSLFDFESKYHNDVFSWIISKMDDLNGSPAAILDLSLDDCLFTSILAKRMNTTNILSVVRDENAHVEPGIEVRRLNIATSDAVTESLRSLGKFDLVLIKDMLHEVEDLEVFFSAIKGNMEGIGHAKIFILTRPKSPPVPLPDCAMEIWRKMAPTREQIIAAAEKAGFKTDSFQASCPIKIDKLEWGRILKTRSIAAVKTAKKCTDKEINDYVQTQCRGRTIEFEEKFLILLFHMKPEGDTSGTTPAPSDGEQAANN